MFTCSSAEDLIISSNTNCEKLHENGWKSITVYEGYCNSIEEDLIIGNNPCLQSITLYKNTLKNLNSLTIINNPQLQSIVTNDGYGGWTSGDSRNKGTGYIVNKLEISGIYSINKINRPSQAIYTYIW